jgi:phosphoglycolate phosphatase-like HAD superfamily hydrolase
MASPHILALDFDGVVCDGLMEYFQTAWRAYCELFRPQSETPPPGLAERFYPLRPVVETGWEMPLLLHGLLQGLPDGKILQDWPTLVPRLLTEAGIEAKAAAQAVDGVRDSWIRSDLEGWLGLHRFYPGVGDRIRQAQANGVQPLIISTKEGRFIQQLLAQQGINLPREDILGKEVKQPKYETLRQLLAQAKGTPPTIWFVEDRLKALQAVRQQSDLEAVRLFLADWGYNTATDRQAATADDRIHCVSLNQFTGPLEGWLAGNAAPTGEDGSG